MSFDQLSSIVCEANQSNIEIVTEKLRVFRNLCATDKNAQTEFGNEDNLRIMCTLFDNILASPSSEENKLCLRVGCQFIANLIVDNHSNQLKVHNMCFGHIRKLMLSGDEKLSIICAMIFYNIILSHREASQDIINDDDVLKAILEQESEFSLFILEKLLLDHGEIEKLYSSCDKNKRIMLLNIIKERTFEVKTIPERCIIFIAETFKRQSDKILKIVSTYVDSVNPEEICALLDTLASISSDSPYLEMLQADKSLFINCAFLLRSIHDAGKSGSNYFTCVPRLPSETSKSNENPVYGFKADLIRLLGNLCYKHNDHKNLIRELECIPVLLDCCNIDDSNPFILQWSIMALKYLSEENHENQAIIAGLSRKDVAHSPVLEDLGFTLHSDDKKTIKIATLKR